MKKETDCCFYCKNCCLCGGTGYECLLRYRRVERPHTDCCGQFVKRRKGTGIKTFETSQRLMKEVENFKYKCEECVSCIWDKEDEDWRCVRLHCLISKDSHACANFKSKEERLAKQEQKKKKEEFQRYLQDVVMDDLQKAITRMGTVYNGINSVDEHQGLKQNVREALDMLKKLRQKVRIEK